MMQRTSTIRLPEHIRQDCADKLRSAKLDDHFKMALGGLLDEAWITPRIVEVIVNPDGYLFGRYDDDLDCQVYLGTARQLLQRIHEIAPVVQLDGDELGFLVGKVAGMKRKR
jgi:hypothetical protein